MTHKHNAPAPEFVARQRLRELSNPVLLCLLRGREPVEDYEGREVRAYQSAGACWRQDDEPTTEAEESRWEMALAFLETEGVAGLERTTHEITDEEGDPVGRIGVAARLTDEGERQAHDLARIWVNDARTLRVHRLRRWLAGCSALAIRQAPSDHPAAAAILEHGRQLMADVRHLMTMEEGQAEAAEKLPPDTVAQLAGLVAVGDDGTPVYARDVWGHVAAEAERHRAAIAEAMRELPRPAPEGLTQYAPELLSLCVALRDAVRGSDSPGRVSRYA